MEEMAVYLLLSAHAHLLDQPEKYSVIWAKETKLLHLILLLILIIL